jgi:hypothetical protein
MVSRQLWAVLLLYMLHTAACVTQTERIGYYPYDRHEDESVWDELRREFGWQKTPRAMAQAPFYQRTTRGLTETVSGWFRGEDDPFTGAQEDAHRLEESRQQFEQERQEAFRRLRLRQELEGEQESE